MNSLLKPTLTLSLALGLVSAAPSTLHQRASATCGQVGSIHTYVKPLASTTTYKDLDGCQKFCSGYNCASFAFGGSSGAECYVYNVPASAMILADPSANMTWFDNNYPQCLACQPGSGAAGPQLMKDPNFADLYLTNWVRGGDANLEYDPYLAPGVLGVDAFQGKGSMTLAQTLSTQVGARYTVSFGNTPRPVYGLEQYVQAYITFGDGGSVLQLPSATAAAQTTTGTFVATSDKTTVTFTVKMDAPFSEGSMNMYSWRFLNVAAKCA